MFLPWSFFQLNLFFLVLDILVAASFMAGLARLSQRTLHRIHSIRWIKQAGLLEMYGLLVTFIGGYALTGILLGAKSFAVISTGERGLSHEVVESRQVIAISYVTTLPAWSIPISYNTSVDDALARAVNSTAAIPRASPTKRYRPHLSDYELACDQLNFKVVGKTGNDSLVLPNAGCATLTIFPPSSMDINLTGSYIVQESKSRAKMVVPGTNSIYNLPTGIVTENELTVRLKVNDKDYCVTRDKNSRPTFATKSGLSYPPSTVVTRCQLLSGEMVNLAVSGIRFNVPDPKEFHDIATSFFGTQDELVTSMEASVNNGILISQSTDRSAQVLIMEVKVMSTEVSALICVGSKLDGVPRIVCVYGVAHSTITKPRSSNPDITQLFPENGNLSVTPQVSIMMSLSHLPSVTVGMEKPTFAIPKVLKSSSIAADYFASLGQNYILYWEGSMLYIAYNTVEIIKGYEIPAGLFYLLIGYWVEGQYKRSLYWQVAQSLATSQNKASPQLHRFDTKQLEFDDRRIVSTRLSQMSKETPIYQQPAPDS
ncbi:hypothetical protein F5H01DRAFT_323350 [Linnemannia elongata]|nr:hypothetical protein F5H01DRAFT_323350 [Linnemannia elongata]